MLPNIVLSFDELDVEAEAENARPMSESFVSLTSGLPVYSFGVRDMPGNPTRDVVDVAS